MTRSGRFARARARDEISESHRCRLRSRPNVAIISSRALGALLPLLLVSGCLYSLRGGGGFPDDVETVFIAPVENRTSQFQIDQELARLLTEQIPRSLGVRLAGEEAADAVVSARITGYTDVAQNYSSGQPGTVQVNQQTVQITAAVQIIDAKRNEILWDSQSLAGRGEYSPESQPDVIAQNLAIESLVEQIIEGAQSQW